MSKLFAVCGSPHSGKTTAALKIAQEIYRSEKGASVVYLSPDQKTPSLGYLFPNCRDSDLRSLGAALDKTDIFKEDVIRQFVNTKTMLNFAFLGFKLGENRYSYPVFTDDKVSQFISALKDTADYIVIDCTCSDGDLLSRIGKRDCDAAVQLFNPDIRSMVYYASCVNEFVPIERKKLKVMNVRENGLCFPIEETKAHFGEPDVVLPYSLPLRQQMITGTLSEVLRDGKYTKAVSKIVKALTGMPSDADEAKVE